MKKLSRMELNVVVNEVLNGLREVENEKLISEFENCSKKDEFLSLCNELDELELKVSELNKKLNVVSSEIRSESSINVVYRNRNNRYSDFGNMREDNKLYNLFRGYGNLNINFSKIESEIILSGIEGNDVRGMINDLIEKFK